MCYWVSPSILLHMRVYYKPDTCRVCKILLYRCVDEDIYVLLVRGKIMNYVVCILCFYTYHSSATS